MTCQSTHNGSVRPDVFPDDFPQALERFKEASGMTWDEIAWLLGTTTATLWRWRNAGIRPSTDYLLAIQDLAESRGLGHLLPPIRVIKVPVQRSGGRRPGQIDAGAYAAPAQDSFRLQERSHPGAKGARPTSGRTRRTGGFRQRRGRERRGHVRPAI